MSVKYTSEKNALILIALLKQHNIKKIIISPGSANAAFVVSVQNDSFFELYSSVDERSAAYMACGIAAETKEPVVISCTGATASRNYTPGLTEAYYRKLPVVAITSTRPLNRIGDNVDQVVDRTTIFNDIARVSVHLPIVNSDDTFWECENKVNKALLECRRRGGGPVHINLPTIYSTDLTVETLPKVRCINRICSSDSMDKYPVLDNKKIGIFVGAHLRWSEELQNQVGIFCEKYNAFVLCDHSSNYKGKYGVYYNLLTSQNYYKASCLDMDVLIHIGDVSASSISSVNEVWRVNPDGEIRDTFKKISNVFEMEEIDFFDFYNSLKPGDSIETTQYNECVAEYKDIYSKLEMKEAEIPFSSLWIAYVLSKKIPTNSVLHLGILNTLRCWNYFEIDKSIATYANTGGFGIDGCVSTLIGASLVSSNTLYLGIVGDLAFFYDMNSIGNRHVENNVRLMVVNNGLGGEFKNNLNPAQRGGVGDAADEFIAAAGHYGNKSSTLVKHYAEDLGFKYLSARNKEEFLKVYGEFVSVDYKEKPILFEVFVDHKEDVYALEMLQGLKESMIGTTKKIAKKLLGEKGIETIKKIVQ